MRCLAVRVVPATVRLLLLLLLVLMVVVVAAVQLLLRSPTKVVRVLPCLQASCWTT